MDKRLHRKEEGKLFLGVCTGLADYFNVDVSIMRILTVALSVFGGGGLILYIAAAVIMPVE